MQTLIESLKLNYPLYESIFGSKESITKYATDFHFPRINDIINVASGVGYAYIWKIDDTPAIYGKVPQLAQFGGRYILLWMVKINNHQWNPVIELSKHDNVFLNTDIIVHQKLSTIQMPKDDAIKELYRILSLIRDYPRILWELKNQPFKNKLDIKKFEKLCERY